MLSWISPARTQRSRSESVQESRNAVLLPRSDGCFVGTVGVEQWIKVNEDYRFRVNAAEDVEVITLKDGWVFDVHQFIGLTQTEQISDIWTKKSGIFHIFNTPKNQRYEGSPYGIPRPYQGDFKKQCVSPKFISFASNFLLSVQPDILPYRKQ